MNEVYRINPELYLSNFHYTDKAALVRYMNDADIAANTLTIPNPYTPADADHWLQKVESLHAEFGRYNNWAIRHDVHGLIGGIGVFFHGGAEHYTDEIGYWLAAPFRGQGWMTEIVRQFTRWMFDTRPNLIRMEAWVFAHNPASVRLLEKAGYLQEGYARQRYVKNGRATDACLLAILRTDLPEQHQVSVQGVVGSG